MSPRFIGKRIFLRYRNKTIKKHRLDYLFWECTLRCNLNCLHCGSDCLKSSGVKDMPVDDFMGQLKKIRKESPRERITVCITGGEPLLRDDLEDAGRKITSLGFRWGIVTNALCMTEARFNSLLDSGMTSISFSLDGLEEDHNLLRKNPKSFKKVVEAIDTARKIQDAKRRPLVFDVITCVHRGNLHRLSELRDFLIRRGVEHWRIFSIFPEGRAAQNSLSLSSREYVMLMDFMEETRKYRTADGKSIHLNYSCEGYLGRYELRVRDFFFFCRAGINVGSIMCDGSVGACLSVRAKAFIQGSIYEDSFPEIWNNRYQNMRDRSWTRCGMCKKCSEYRYCLGNGLHLHADDRSAPTRCNLSLIKEGS